MKTSSVVKKILLACIVLALLFIGVNAIPKEYFKILRKYASTLFKENCESPLIYSISDIDPRFKISKPEALKIALEAEKLWEDTINVDLFEYRADSDRDIVIDFIYGKRQEKTLAENESGTRIDANWEKYETLLKQYNDFGKTYEARVADYNTKLKTNDADVERFNQRIASWKKNPGSNAEYDVLKKEEERLRKNDAIFKAESTNLQSISASLKKQKSELDALWTKYNNVAKAHDEIYATGEEVEEAVFDGLFKINVYVYDNKDDLRSIIAHEMGHALGIDHLTQKKSVMYYLQNSEQNVKNLTLSEEDVGALKQVCNLN